MIRSNCFKITSCITALVIFDKAALEYTTFLFDRNNQFLRIPGYCLCENGNMFRHKGWCEPEEPFLFIKGCPITTYIQSGVRDDSICAKDFSFVQTL